MSNKSLTVTRVASGSPIEPQRSQSPEIVEVPPEDTSEETLNNEASPVQVVPPIYFNPVPKMIHGQDRMWLSHNPLLKRILGGGQKMVITFNFCQI